MMIETIKRIVTILDKMGNAVVIELFFIDGTDKKVNKLEFDVDDPNVIHALVHGSGDRIIFPLSHIHHINVPAKLKGTIGFNR